MTDEDFRNTPRVWNRYDTNNLGEYEDLHSIIDVLLLSDVFKKYRKNVHKKYDLDIVSFITVPSFS